MNSESKDTWKSEIFRLVREKMVRIFARRKKQNLWKEFINKNVSGQKISAASLEKIFKETYPGEFEEFLNSGEMQLSIIFSRLRALETVVTQTSPHLREKLADRQLAMTEEIIAREWLAYKSGRFSASDFYDFLENKD